MVSPGNRIYFRGILTFIASSRLQVTVTLMFAEVRSSETELKKHKGKMCSFP